LLGWSCLMSALFFSVLFCAVVYRHFAAEVTTDMSLGERVGQLIKARLFEAFHQEIPYNILQETRCAPRVPTHRTHHYVNSPQPPPQRHRALLDACMTLLCSIHDLAGFDTCTDVAVRNAPRARNHPQTGRRGEVILVVATSGAGC
jgi:hypothetical protein